MQGAKDYMGKHEILDRISFKDGKAHTVKLLNDKIDTINAEGEDREGVKFLVEENGEHKSFFTSSESLIIALARYEKGDTVTIQMVRRKGKKGFISSFIVSEGSKITDSQEGDLGVNDPSDIT